MLRCGNVVVSVYGPKSSRLKENHDGLEFRNRCTDSVIDDGST